MANPVDYDTRDGCTRLGAGKGSLHLMEHNRQTLLWHLVYCIETAPCTILFYYAQWPGANFILRLLQK